MPSPSSTPTRPLRSGGASEARASSATTGQCTGQSAPIMLPQRVTGHGLPKSWKPENLPMARRIVPAADPSFLRQTLVRTAAARVLASVGEGTGMAAAVERVIDAMTAEHPNFSFPDSRPGPRRAVRETRSGRGSKSAPRLLTPGEVLAACIAEKRRAEAERTGKPQATGTIVDDIDATF